MLLGEPTDSLREPELVEVRNLRGDDAEGERDRAALAKAVDAEAWEPVGRVGDVELTRLVEVRELRRRQIGDEREGCLEVAVVERRLVRDQAELAVPPHHRRLADFEMDIARAEFHGARQDSVQVHEGPDRHRRGAA